MTLVRTLLPPVISGALFGAGLTLSGMTDGVPPGTVMVVSAGQASVQA